LKISKSSWHYRFVVRTHDTWLKGYSDLDIASEKYYNLCPYLRDVLIWSPLTWILGAIYTVTLRPFILLGGFFYWQYAKRTYVIANGKITVDSRGQKVRLREKPFEPPVKRTGPGLWSLIGEWFEARHQQICPRVEFVAEQDS